MLIRTTDGHYVPLTSVHYLAPIGSDLALHTTGGQKFHVSGEQAEAIRANVLGAARPAKTGGKANDVRKEEVGR